jgi:ABC-2 type transport system permease protein
LALGTLVYGDGPYGSPTGETLPYGTAVLRLLLCVVYLALYLAWVAGVSTLLSVATDAPLGAVGGAVLISILSQILDSIDALGWVRDALPTHYAFAWSDLLTVDVDATDVVRGVLAGLVWAMAFGATAVWWFRRKDID